MTHYISLKHQFLATTLSVGAVLLLNGCASKRLSYNHELLGSREMIPPPYAAAPQNAPQPAHQPQAAPAAVTFQPQDASFTAVPPENEPLPPAAEPLQPVFTETQPAKKQPAAKTKNAKATKPAPKPVVKPAAGQKYTVKKGDTLGGIAATFGLRWPALAKANPGINPNRLLVGQTLLIPTDKKAAAKTSSAAKAKNQKARPQSAVNGIHTVVAGENIWVIARRYKVKRDDIRNWNNLSTDVLKIGQKLRIKSDAPAVAGKNQTTRKSAPSSSQEKQPAVEISEEATAELLRQEQKNPPTQKDKQELKKLEEGINTPPETLVAPQKTAVSNLAHSVMNNDTLESIAKMYDTTVEAILKQNPQVKSDADLKEGMSIIIPYTK